MRSWAIGNCSMAGLGLTALVALGSFPLGVAGEWTWPRTPWPVDAALSAVLLVIAGGVFAGVVAFGARRIAAAGRGETALWLVGLWLAGCWWMWTLQESAAEFRLNKAAWVLYYHGSSGYFTQARDHGRPVRRFLATYEERLAERDVLHLGTHPPGLTLVFTGLLSLFESSPGLADAVLATQSESAKEAFGQIAEHTAAGPQPLTRPQQAALWAAGLLVLLLAAGTVVPLFLLVRRDHGPVASWLCAALWPLVPAATLFWPKSDCLFAGLGMLVLWLWLSGWRTASPARCLAAGLVFWIGMGLSLALLPVGFLAAGGTLWEGWLCRRAERVPSAGRVLLRSLGWGSLGFLVPTILVWGTTGLNLFRVWGWNYVNHAGFYDQYPRTYFAWLAINPLELATALGWPAALCAAWSLGRRRPSAWSRSAGWAWGVLLTWGLLWLSGKNMGEAARLWIFLMPWLVVLTASAFESDDERVDPVATWLVLATGQGIAATLLVMRIVGFHNPLAG